MSQTISEASVRHAAALSRLKLSDEQIRFYTEQLAGILDYIAKLNELDVDDVEPMAHPTDIVNRFRDDEVGDSLSMQQVLANAPQAEPPFFKVPKVLGDGSGA
ncbi:MAG: Asp-tRNA(Asn)/Glu-tRNA(Gln) amidotransferase subunit GatC [Phycisphaeraceae bacterium]|nr:Asp-tRNA(Asn)/Glu-tRNA(Gln) amidotransferase subunit GatC [Phycisphaeraceae bacterium]